jgi:nucleotide-binding universal stress UspA family protein
MEKERAMQNILVAIDGLPGSEKALEAAVQQAQLKDGGITALAVLDHGGIPSLPILDRSSDPELKRILEGAKVQARRHLEETLEAAVNFARSRGVQLTPVLREGHPAETIIACAEQESADLVVLGGHNGDGRHAWLGGTADQVSSYAHCTVMIVK